MSRPIRVLTIGHSYSIALNRAVAREVARSGEFEITVVAPRFFHGDLRPITLDPEPPGSKLKIVGIRSYLTRWIHAFAYNWAELSKLASRDFDVVHAWQEPYIFAGYQVARTFQKSRAKYIFRTAQNLVKEYPPPFGRFERLTLDYSDGWVAGGQLVFEAMLQRGYPAEKGNVISLGVDTDAFRPMNDAAKAKVRQQFGLKSPVIAFVGRLTKAKGLEVLQAALDQIPANVPWSLLILGSGPLESALRAWAVERHRDRPIQIVLARHEQMPDILPAADIMVAPSQTTSNWREQFGRMIIEAFASGVPVIGSDSGEIPRVIADAGLVLPEKNVAAWAEAIRLLLDSPSKRRELAQLGLRRVDAYSTHTVARKYANLYRSLAA